MTKKQKYTPQERREYNRKRTKELTLRLLDAMKDGLMTAEDWLKYAAKFHKYSLQNMLLIYMQNPNAELVAGFHDWKRKHGRHVKKGCTGKNIRILAPVIKKWTTEEVNEETGEVEKTRHQSAPLGFKVVNVYDIADTEGKEPPVKPQWRDDTNNSKANGLMLNYAKSRGIKIDYHADKILGKSAGAYSPAEKTILLPANYATVTLVHEITHAVIHNLDFEKYMKELRENKEQTPAAWYRQNRETAEIQAEATGGIIAAYIGLPIERVSNYMNLWNNAKEPERILEILNPAQKFSRELITLLEEANL